MIDIHCHILPGIDDGSKDIDMSLEMLGIAENNSEDKIIATPHYYRGYFENEYKDVVKYVSKLNNDIKSNNLNVKVYPGQEIFVDNHTLECYKSGIIHGLNDSKYLLIEFSMEELPQNAMDIIYELKLLGVKPIIAHPERYMYIWKELTNINQFVEENCLFQLNTSSILGLMGKHVKETAFELMEHGLCNFIASDAHTTDRRCPNLSVAMDEIKEDYSDIYSMVQKNANAVLKDEDININMKAIKPKKSIFSFFKK